MSTTPEEFDAHLRALGTLALIDSLDLPEQATPTDVRNALAAKGLRIVVTAGGAQ